MKQLLFLLLFPSLLFSQQVQYFARFDDNWREIRDFAVAVLLPDNYDPAKKYAFEISIHGIGERGGCREEDLENLVLGFDYNRDGIREGPAFVNPDKKRAVNDYDIILFIPNYGTREFFEPHMINYIYDFAQKNYSVVDKMFLNGFSYGGGATLKYITSSTENARRVAYAAPCAPTYNVVDASVPGKVGLPVHFFVNTRDPNGATNIDVTKKAVTAINASNPPIKALYTAFNMSGHGGYNEAMTISPPRAPGGEGVTDAAKNVYQTYKDILGTVEPPPTKTIKMRLYLEGKEMVIYSDWTVEVK